MRRKMILALLILVVLTGLGGTYMQRYAVACEFLPLTDYDEIHHGVFVSPSLTHSYHGVFVELTRAAQERIQTTYGAPLSKPRIVITANAEEAADWGANATASMHRMPWRSCIIIGPEGRNIDVIAHESLHAEIQQRVGFFRFLKEIPTWFDEGVALTLDYRAPFLPENIELTEQEIEAVKLLRSGNDFYTVNARQNYQAARMAVEPLITPNRFYEDLERIATGETFENIFMTRRD